MINPHFVNHLIYIIKHHHHRKDNTELVQVPRSGKFTKIITVPGGKKLSVDSYINEGPIDISITVSKGKEVQILSDKIIVKPSENKDDGPTRNLQVFLPAEESRQVTIIWSNPAKFATKPLIYALTVADSDRDSQHITKGL